MEFLDFLSTHMPLIGWPAILLLLWRLGVFIAKFMDRYLTKFEERVAKAEQTIDAVATNHLPHIEQGLKDVTAAVNTGFGNLTNQLLILAGKTKD